jgi:predicted CoA-substrate-specific enzyme activase
MPDFSAGIDIGSVATKAVVLRDGIVVGRSLVRTGAAAAAAARDALGAALRDAGAARDDLDRVVATGYGRRAIDFADDVITEITACARGARACGGGPTPRLIVDVGGQDTKVILLDRDGTVRDFAMNDRCAAGTGRFLEVMADALDVPLDRFGELAAAARRPASINATCTVFAESEVVSLVASGAEPADIVAGVLAAVASRVAQMAGPMAGEDDGPVLFCGGGARNAGLRAALERALGVAVDVPPEPQHVVALGAALTAPRCVLEEPAPRP